VPAAAKHASESKDSPRVERPAAELLVPVRVLCEQVRQLVGPHQSLQVQLS
jgi:hypothetical protein